MRYDVKFLCYNGMNVPLLEGAYADDVRRLVRMKIKRYRKLGFTVERIRDCDKAFKFEWEVQSGSDVMVTDDDGYLVVKRAQSSPLYRFGRRF